MGCLSNACNLHVTRRGYGATITAACSHLASSSRACGLSCAPMDATHTITDYEHSDVLHTDPANRRDDEALRAGEEQVDLLPARGIALSLVIGAGLWALILATGWLIFH